MPTISRPGREQIEGRNREQEKGAGEKWGYEGHNLPFLTTSHREDRKKNTARMRASRLRRLQAAAAGARDVPACSSLFTMNRRK